MHSVSVGGVEVFDADVIHDSTRELFRSPLGAVTHGTEIRLALQLTSLRVESASLCVLGDGVLDRLAMELEDNWLRARLRVPFDEDRRGMAAYGQETPAGNRGMAAYGQETPAGNRGLAADGQGMPADKRGTPTDGQGMVLWYWFELVLPGGAPCYYGAVPPCPSGLGRIYQGLPPAFQITVYDERFTTPDWAKTAVMYQIFPDRFHRGNPDGMRDGILYHQGLGRREIELHENWDDTPLYEAKAGQADYVPSDIFGGDLEGIRLRLGYLASLGVTLLYLNPIFEASSNHRYNTGDYLKIDPILGDESTFRRLVHEAREAGIRIILDGVFSHTGDDSRYFNKYGYYESLGAYQSRESPYLGWYRFDEYPEAYSRWWGFETLPEVNEDDPGWRDFVISGQGSVVKHWLEEGVAGYRLDVADELPDEVIELIRSTLKETDSQAFLLGEVWEDATTKVSYGRQRSYALGRGLDSVMNYPFLSQTIEFVCGKTNARQYQRFLLHQQQAYPPPMYYTLMNLVSSHDVCRVRSVLSRDWDLASMSRAEQAQAQLTEDELLLGGLRQRLVAAIQFSLPGIPAVYYGDEVGMTGLLDPFNRRTWRKEDPAMVDWYRWLGNLRRQKPVMSTGFARFFATNGKVLGILRHTVCGCDYFGREMDPDAVLTLINPTNNPQRIVLEGDSMSGGWAKGDKGTVNVSGGRSDCHILLAKCDNQTVPLTHLPSLCHTLNGLLEVNMPPCSIEIFSLEQ